MTESSADLDAKLISGEEVVFATRKHWMAPVADSRWAILLLVGAALLAWLQPEDSGAITGFLADLAGFAKVVLLIGGLGWIAYNVVAWRTSRFAVTNRRVLGRDGLLRRRSTDTLLSSISDVQSEVPFLGRTFGYGTIRILSAAGRSGSDRFSTIRDVEGFKQAVLEQKAGQEAQAPSAAAATASAPAPTATTGTSAEATEALANLARLRDAGAITNEEFEAKKIELLNRI
jgi:uncharacterized membrane protein YdbT with pleckstrin-like domain